MQKFLIIGLILLTNNAQSQSADSLRYMTDMQKELSVIAGINISRYPSVETGIGLLSYGRVGPHPHANSATIGAEFQFGKDILIGPKLSVHVMGHSLIGFGLHLIRYTNFDSSCTVFRPDIGFGMERVKLAYGFNIIMNNKDFDLVRRHVFSFVYLIKLKNYKRELR